jgi:hypothetical protein
VEVAARRALRRQAVQPERPALRLQLEVALAQEARARLLRIHRAAAALRPIRRVAVGLRQIPRAVAALVQERPVADVVVAATPVFLARPAAAAPAVDSDDQLESSTS